MDKIALAHFFHRTYYSGEFDSDIATVTQVVSIPNYTTVTVNNGSSITASAWDGYSGGIIALKAQASTTNNGNINANGKGYRGGDEIPHDGNGSPGGSYTGTSIAIHQKTANDGTGGYVYLVANNNTNSEIIEVDGRNGGQSSISSRENGGAGGNGYYVSSTNNITCQIYGVHEAFYIVW
ncbi:MAG: hypothetical protein QM487_02370 [Candidatus Marithrix sp.]